MGRDAVQKIGFQMMCMVRLMQSSHRAGISVLPKVISRCIRHLYGADIHWEAKMAPGVVIIHGMGLVVSHSAEVAKGCILFHGVTLGEGIDADTRKVGAPRLGENVHVGPGSSLIGPIEIGAGTKIAAGSVLTLSVGPKSRVYPGHTEIKSSDAI
jgi:serine O-acetyltransferase